MYTTDRIGQSLVNHLSDLLPGVTELVDGDDRKVYYPDPTAKSPSVAVTVGPFDDYEEEMGSMSRMIRASIYINGKSKNQRNALSDIVFNAFRERKVNIYATFSGGDPVGDPDGEARIFTVRSTSLPDFSEDKERMFWRAVVTVNFSVLGV